MGTEEFTFPISSDTARAFIDSPPLWRRVGHTQTTTSTSSSPSKETEQLCSPTSRTHQRKSFSEIEVGVRSLHHRSIEMDGHDRMDLLWEDFNEEIRRKQKPFICSSALRSSSSSSSSSSSDDLPDFGCVPTAFNLSKAANGGGGRAVVANGKKVGVVVLAKVLKRFFLLRHQPAKKRAW